jgi:hypothetical protein
MKKEEITKLFQALYDEHNNIRRFLIIELREKEYGLFDKRLFNAYCLTSDRIDNIVDGEVLMCPYLGMVEDINASMFNPFNDIILTLNNPTLCIFFSKQNNTYKCGVFALEEK